MWLVIAGCEKCYAKEGNVFSKKNTRPEKTVHSDLIKAQWLYAADIGKVLKRSEYDSNVLRLAFKRMPLPPAVWRELD